jgi:hypothetical protein
MHVLATRPDVLSEQAGLTRPVIRPAVRRASRFPILPRLTAWQSTQDRASAQLLVHDQKLFGLYRVSAQPSVA